MHTNKVPLYTYALCGGGGGGGDSDIGGGGSGKRS